MLGTGKFIKGARLVTRGKAVLRKAKKIQKSIRKMDSLMKNSNWFTSKFLEKTKSYVMVAAVEAAEGTFKPDPDEEKRDDYKECMRLREEYKDRGYRVSDRCYSGMQGVTGLTGVYCFNYNAKETQRRDIDN